MDVIFVNSKNSKTSEAQRLLLNLLDNINVKGKDKYIPLSDLNKYYIQKHVKKVIQKQ